MPQTFRCQVVDCSDALPQGKAYYRRYRICFRHANVECMVVNGLPMRWCQQCGRFQDTAAFDLGKKTCRQRLAQHNAQRRLARERRGGASRSPSTEMKEPSAYQNSPPQTATPIVSGSDTPSAVLAAPARPPSSSAFDLTPGAIEFSGSIDSASFNALDGIDADVDTLLGILEAPAPTAVPSVNGATKFHHFAPGPEPSAQTGGLLSMASVREYSLKLFGLHPEALPPTLLSSLMTVLEAKEAHALTLGKKTL